ncbi:TPA: O113 family O-antigen flippase [Escherichia coli]
MEKNSDKLRTGVRWSAIERIITQIAQLGILLILSRILGPKAYGLIGMLTIFIAISQTLVDSGFSSALIRRNKNSQKQYSTIFWFNLIVSLLIYAVIFFMSPHISAFYREKELSDILRVLSLLVIINALSIVHRARLTIMMDFKTQTKISLIAVLGSGVVSVILAKNGWGVWALVVNNLVFATISTFLYFWFCKWLPDFIFQLKFFKVTAAFSVKLMIASLLNTFFDNIYQLVIGKVFYPTQVGYFTQAKNLTLLPANTYSAIIQRVTYRYFSEIKNDRVRLRQKYEEVMRISAFIFFPLMISFSIFSNNIIVFLIGKEWEEAAKYISILSWCYVLYPIHAISLNILNVFGRSDLFLKVEIIKKIIITVCLITTYKYGISAICMGMVFYSLLATYINTIHTNRIIKTNFIALIRIISPIAFISMLSATISFVICKFFDNNIIYIFGIMISLIIYYLIYYFVDRKIVLIIWKVNK